MIFPGDKCKLLFPTWLLGGWKQLPRHQAMLILFISINTKGWNEKCGQNVKPIIYYTLKDKGAWWIKAQHWVFCQVCSEFQNTTNSEFLSPACLLCDPFISLDNYRRLGCFEGFSYYFPRNESCQCTKTRFLVRLVYREAILLRCLQWIVFAILF